jgi:hypothetical protein
MAFDHQYTAVAEDDKGLEAEFKNRARFRSAFTGHWATLGFFPWLLTTTLLAGILFVLVAAVTREPTEAQCAAKLSVWCMSVLRYCPFQPLTFFIAPALEVIDYVDVQFQNSFNEKSIYRGKPTPELEKAWLDLWNCASKSFMPSSAE